MDHKCTCQVMSLIGTRDNNEDRAGVFEKNGDYCFTLADGLGGHGRGEVASQSVLDTAGRIFTEQGWSQDILDRIFTEAQNNLMDLQKELHAVDEMKTTMVSAVVHDGVLRFGHVGDSRLYLFRNRKIFVRTYDHSVPQMLVYAGEISEAKIRNHPDRNRLMRVMGTDWEKPMYELSGETELRTGDSLLLCTDGFWEPLEERKMISAHFFTKTPAEWMDKMRVLIDKKMKGQDMDNCTAIAVFVN